MNELKLLSCDSKGILELEYGEHTLTTNVARIFKWRSATIDKSSPLKVDIEDQLYKLKCLIEKGTRRGKRNSDSV